METRTIIFSINEYKRQCLPLSTNFFNKTQSHYY